jgi:signal recognition particle subunit SRP72
MAPKAPVQTAKSSPLAGKQKGKDSARKSGPKPPLAIPDRLKRLFTSLCAQIDGGHFNNAIKTCEKSVFSLLHRSFYVNDWFLTSSSAGPWRR